MDDRKIIDNPKNDGIEYPYLDDSLPEIILIRSGCV